MHLFSSIQAEHVRRSSGNHARVQSKPKTGAVARHVIMYACAGTAPQHGSIDYDLL